MKNLFKPNAFYFTPLGGSEEFGTNLNLYVCNNEFLAIDCGIGFADDRFPGIDLLLPNPQLLEENKDRLKGIVITHAHEDHIGAVAYLWERFKCPLYASPFTASVLRKKLEEQGLSDAKINIIKPDSSIQVGAFHLTFLPVSHSVPDSCAVFIETEHGNVLHSGDWNLDHSPVIGEKTEEARFRSLAEKGVLAYIGDSTNAQVNGYAGSESDVSTGMEKEFKQHSGKIVVTIFASNIGRLVSIARAAEKSGRSVVLIGRSLHRMSSCARECGYLDNDIPDFLSEDDLDHIPDDQIVLVVTGSQGEHRAALARISRGDHRSAKLTKGDTVIFSSRAIPGNDRRINTVKNDLIASGVQVVTPEDTKNTIHVSGHPCREEISTILQWIRPQCVIPVHGERLQLDAHAKLAEDCQVNQTIVPCNGSVIRLAPDNPEIIDHVETGLLAVDLRRIIPATHQSITARRKLQYSGTVHASLVLNQDLHVLGEIKIDTVGISCTRSDDCITDDLRAEIQRILQDLQEDGISRHEDELAEQVRIGLRRYVIDMLGLKPKTTIHITVLDI
ncbi:MAG: ribonuclease J [Alphaproteobacteria bacterium]